ncbi:MAG TPA: lytic murein transglycosylase [Bauldia sp.]|nr:lytic murein transglycosylase [Bauldia sp.]
MTRAGLYAAAAVLLAAGATGAVAAGCQKEPSFEAWLANVKKEAAASGVSAGTISTALAGVRFDPSIVAKDRAQKVFAQTFLEFSDRMVAGYRLKTGAAKIAALKPLFQKIEKKYGVPAPVIVAFWGLETDFGANIGNLPTLVSVATLAYDCRRPDVFRPQLIDALKVIDRGDLTADQMRGPWAGELGQLQFLPSHYLDYGVDFDGDGKVNLLTSTADVLASGANLLAAHGWQRGQPWIQEVKVPPNLPWQEADLAIQHPRSQWAAWGVTYASGKPIPSDGVPASILLPMGRNGPAFLAYKNFLVYLEWNSSLVYSTTAAYFATRLAGAGPVTRGDPPPGLTLAQGKELQNLLAKRGYDIGVADGIIGLKTRAAVKAMQIKFKMPADSYPTAELIAKLRGG